MFSQKKFNNGRQSVFLQHDLSPSGHGEAIHNIFMMALAHPGLTLLCMFHHSIVASVGLLFFSSDIPLCQRPSIFKTSPVTMGQVSVSSGASQLEN